MTATEEKEVFDLAMKIALAQHIDLTRKLCLLLGGPGFENDVAKSAGDFLPEVYHRVKDMLEALRIAQPKLAGYARSKVDSALEKVPPPVEHEQAEPGRGTP